MDVTIDPAQLILSGVALGGLLSGLRQKKKSVARQETVESARQELDRRETERKAALDANAAKDTTITQLQGLWNQAEARAEQQRIAGEAWYEKWLRCESERDRERGEHRAEVTALAKTIVSQAQLTAARDGVVPGDIPAPPEHEDPAGT